MKSPHRDTPTLNWRGKEELPPFERCVLLEGTTLRTVEQTTAQGDQSVEPVGVLIHGDNLPGLHALKERFSEQIKCAYLDPPYNTGASFEHYEDRAAHGEWLTLMRARLLSIRELLREDGFLCAQIDDSEGPYLKVLLDEIFGRQNYLTTLYIRVRYAKKRLKEGKFFHREIECIHIYRRSPLAQPLRLTRSLELDRFCHSIEVTAPPARVLELGGRRVELFTRGGYRITRGESSLKGLKEIWASGTILDGNSSGRFFRDQLAGRVEDDGLGALYRVEGLGDDALPYRYFTGPRRAGATKGRYYQGVPLGERSRGARGQTIASFYDLAGAFGNCRHEGGVDFRGGKKPEALLELLLRHLSEPGDWILDPFAGSGTTGAVAHKLGRRWVMIERGPQFRSHIIPRLQAIIEGRDAGGVRERFSWGAREAVQNFTLVPASTRR